MAQADQTSDGAARDGSHRQPGGGGTAGARGRAGRRGRRSIGGEIVDPPAQSIGRPSFRRNGAQRDKPGKSASHRARLRGLPRKGTVGRLWGDGGPKLRMIWTDPPYGVDYAAKNAYLNRSDRGNRIQVPIENDKLTAGETGFLFKAALSVAKSWAQTGASLYATVPSGPLLVYFIQAFTAAGFTFRAQLAWVKQQFVIGMADYHHRLRANPVRLATWRPLFRRRSQPGRRIRGRQAARQRPSSDDQAGGAHRPHGPQQQPRRRVVYDPSADRLYPARRAPVTAVLGTASKSIPATSR